MLVQNMKLHVPFLYYNRYIINCLLLFPGNPRLTGTGTVIVQVKDENDNVPIFHHRHYLGRVSEDASFHSSILQVRATDADTDKNAEIR